MPNKIELPTVKPREDMKYLELTALYNDYARYARKIGLPVELKAEKSMFASKEIGVRIINERLIAAIAAKEAGGEAPAKTAPAKAKRAVRKAAGRATATPRRGRAKLRAVA